MCLLTFAYRCHPDYSLILLANRDEFYARPTRDMHHWQEGPVLAGQDLEQGGTWLGLNRYGRFATVTNVRDARNPHPGTRSRGHLTRNYLLGAADAAAYLQQLAPEQAEYGAYNLLLGDRHGLYYSSNKHPHSIRLKPGLYGLSNAALDSPWPKLLAARARLGTAIETGDLEPDTLLALMQHATTAEDQLLPDTGVSYEWEKRLSACFIRSDSYGTRATTLLLQKPDGETTVYERTFDADGRVDQQQFSWTIPAIG